jgi:hypothetical protein
LQQVERFMDIGRRAFLSCVRDDSQPQASRAGEDVGEFRRWMTDFGGIEPDAVDAAEIGERFVERRLGIGFAEMAEKAHDEFRADAVVGLRIVKRAGDACDHGLERDAAFGMSLRVEEDFDMANGVGVGARQIGGGEVVEVLLAVEDAHALIINVEEILKIRKGVRRAHFVDRCEGDRDIVALSKLEHQFGFERAFDMQMEFSLGERGDEGGAVGGGGEAISHRPVPLRAE